MLIMTNQAENDAIEKAVEPVDEKNKSYEELIWEIRALKQKIADWEASPNMQSPVNKNSNKVRVFKKKYEYSLSELIDVPLAKKLMNSIYAATGTMHAILDHEGNILSATGWTDLCKLFHRINPATENRCRQSDQYICDHLKDGNYIGYKCLNGLMDYCTPIIVEGQHLGTIFMGQVLHEPADKEYFRRQAREFGFDEAAYMKALMRVPVIPKSAAQSLMEFYSRLAQVLVAIGIEKKRQLEAAENEIRLSEDKFYKAFHCSPDIVTISTLKDGYYSEVNETFINKIGYERYEAIGRQSRELGVWLNPSARDLMVNNIINNGKINNYEALMRTRDGNIMDVLVSADQIEIKGQPYLLCVIRDITEQKSLQNEMIKLDRLNLVGEMAAGIGHEIRNPMTAVRGFLQMFGFKYSEDKEIMDLMIEELDQANSIITEFLSLAKDKVAELKPRQLNSVIRDIMPMLETNARSKDKGIKLELNRVPYLMLDEKEIRQMILNLVQNGLESMSSSGGYVTIKTYREEEKAVLSVKDQGCGIKREELDKLGIPFFTTKANGIGLGLAVCYGIAQRHNARIDIESSGRGTTFYVRFPIIKGHPWFEEYNEMLEMTRSTAKNP